MEASATQWRIASGGPTGLDYAGAEAAARGMGMRWPDVFAGVAAMEAEYLEAVSDRAGRRTA